ncbi:MAG: (d)CMP kinase [Flavobacterium sp.]|uniref:(d)CMP kinase n=1 Tax=Flavobacterium sp. TaxID=239 RepID=UPI0022C40340|nr:(d)CMP kinase [Flavobacterium sp.]MCZ8169068.1 (d)CMP kinase [Flavobacterium sp.]MCZ8297153.1 (d)CMP kinase [Flavobacterium sp.]
MKKITIAIDGFSSTGKSTLAKQLAQQLGYVYVDTGAMYRAVTLYAMQHGFVSPHHLDAEVLTADLKQITLHFVFNAELGYGEMYLNGINVEREIRTLEVSSLVSKVAEISAVRAKLVEQQQAMGKEKGVVMDGRDIGTVVFPDAALKIYMTASPETRAQRRFAELQAKGDSVTYEAVLQNVNERDYIDTHRADSPLVKADDAIELDNSNLSREAQLQRVLEWVDAKTKSM